jgi:hypothetical protein
MQVYSSQEYLNQTRSIGLWSGSKEACHITVERSNVTPDTEQVLATHPNIRCSLLSPFRPWHAGVSTFHVTAADALP